MIRQLARATNLLLRPLGVRIVRDPQPAPDPRFTMDAMLGRLAARDIPIGTIVDIGASDGKWSVACMRHFPDARYLAVEALEEREPLLAQVRARHPTFRYARCVAGARDGESVTLNVTADLEGSTVDGANAGDPRRCVTRSIDSLLAEHDLPGPYLLKFDTHGYELPILAGCTRALGEANALLLETYNFRLTPASLRFPETCAHLQGLGFELADVADPMLRQHDQLFWQVDMLFLRSSLAEFGYPHYA